METLDQRMRQVIGQLATSARMSKLISINAALITEQIQQSATHDAAALKVVAMEIQRLSDESSSGIASLQAILDDVRRLSHTINLAGRQRMLSQKIMKLHVLQRAVRDTPTRAAELDALIRDFETATATLVHSPLNTPAISAQLARATQAWDHFKRALSSPDLAASNNLNESLLRELHAVVVAYEELAGTRVAQPPSDPPAPSPTRPFPPSPAPAKRTHAPLAPISI